jgi:hypothetical protein
MKVAWSSFKTYDVSNYSQAIDSHLCVILYDPSDHPRIYLCKMPILIGRGWFPFGEHEQSRALKGKATSSFAFLATYHACTRSPELTASVVSYVSVSGILHFDADQTVVTRQFIYCHSGHSALSLLYCMWQNARLNPSSHEVLRFPSSISSQ